MTYLLDTNAVIAFLNGEKAIATLIQSANSKISSVILGELLYGAANSTKVRENTERALQFADGSGVIVIDKNTAQEFGHIKAVLRRKGRLIPDNDIWIAATARQHQLDLVTRDDHFNNIDNLKIIGW